MQVKKKKTRIPKNIRPKGKTKTTSSALAKRVKMQRAQMGAGFFDSIKNGVLSALRFAKQHKLISRGANALSAVGVPYMGTVGKISGTLGYGKRKTQKGKGKGSETFGYVGSGLHRAGTKQQRGSGRKKKTTTTTGRLKLQRSFP